MEEKAAEKISEVYINLTNARELKREFDHASNLARLGDVKAKERALELAELISTLYVNQSEGLLKKITTKDMEGGAA